MKLLLPDDIASRLNIALAKAKRQEIGGLVVGEHVMDETFRIVDISIQTSHGTRTHFERDPILHEKFLREFFRRTGENYERYNYLGEWHSHPSFDPLPSTDDVRTMRSIVSDPDVGVNFAVLLIVRRTSPKKLALSATAFSRSLPPEPVIVVADVGTATRKRNLMETSLDWLRNLVS
ncbi:Mov34/MPN/PAD-1 family protein [Aminobacter sp. MSH1]|uniref:Mov34/MPN/PAD-1 family protein n=1 Tax=Aminobacter sp. MSH1 TaxID=374606 RepID=UPI00131EE11E|nr:Mov34/MPN/PAD-1 family protein [Aminobacter sp. MSH1]